MEVLTKHLVAVDDLRFTGDQRCIESLDNILQDIIEELTRVRHRASGELLELKGCSWVLHERYHMDSVDDLKWTFNHTKFRILKNTITLINYFQARERNEMIDEINIKVA
jgi:hypothetical protein